MLIYIPTITVRNQSLGSTHIPAWTKSDHASKGIHCIELSNMIAITQHAQ